MAPVLEVDIDALNADGGRLEARHGGRTLRLRDQSRHRLELDLEKIAEQLRAWSYQVD
jgi:hypothetical protein